MSETKYGKYIVKEPVKQWKWFKGINWFSEENVPMNFSIQWNTIGAPFRLPDEAHSHDFDEVWIFLGSDARYPLELGGEIEMYFGAEQEKHVVNYCCIVQIPAGMVHCPLIFTKVDKPIAFLNIPLVPHYTKKNLVEKEEKK